MRIPILLPGQDFLMRDIDYHGREVYVYAFMSKEGQLFTHTAPTEEEARKKVSEMVCSQ